MVQTTNQVRKVKGGATTSRCKPFVAGKTAQIPLFLLNPTVLIILAVVLVILLLSFFGLAIFITLNVFTVLGLVLAIVGLIGILRGNIPVNVGVGLVIGGVVLVALPFLFGELSRLTLAAVLT